MKTLEWTITVTGPLPRHGPLMWLKLALEHFGADISSKIIMVRSRITVRDGSGKIIEEDRLGWW